jgi:hypothetical protein
MKNRRKIERIRVYNEVADRIVNSEFTRFQQNKSVKYFFIQNKPLNFN